MIPDRADKTLARTDPVLWSRISHEPDGQTRHSGGLFTWHRFSPSEAVGEPQGRVVTGDAFLVLASEVTAAEWQSLFAALRQTFVIISCLLLALLVISGRFFLLNQRAVMELRNNKQMFERLFENSPEATILVDKNSK